MKTPEEKKVEETDRVSDAKIFDSKVEFLLSDVMQTFESDSKKNSLRAIAMCLHELVKMTRSR